MRKHIDSFFEERLRTLRGTLSGTEALWQLTLLGLVCGVVTACVIILFRWLIEWPLSLFLAGGNPENFESLSTIARAVLPLSGAFILAVVWYRIGIRKRKVGVTLVMERLNYHQGHITGSSVLAQFFGGVLSIISGQSSGREGPAVHLGAGTSSLLGQYLKLPNNSIRTLVSCGTAAAISASFNTPIAGVIFAMEVVMMEYSIKGFTPVIMASVVAALLSQAVYGVDPAFIVPQLNMESNAEVIFIILLGVIIGVGSAMFVRITELCITHVKYSIFTRIMIAGAITAGAAVVVPQIMGIGYDTVNGALLGEIGFGVLLMVGVTKLVITSSTVGLGMPNGLVGPTLVIGACIGGAMGIVASALFPDSTSSHGFYAMLGMGAMMGSVLQAPLAALMALLELTQNPNIILPGMLAIIVSSMVASEIFKQQSIFLTILKCQGMDYQNSPVTQALRRVSVGAIMKRNFAVCEAEMSYAESKAVLKQEPKWLVLKNAEGEHKTMIPAIDLARFIEEHRDEIDAMPEDERDDYRIKLQEMPAQREELCAIYFQATLQEALDKLNETGSDALYVERAAAPMITRVIGVMRRSDIENYYSYKGSK